MFWECVSKGCNNKGKQGSVLDPAIYFGGRERRRGLRVKLLFQMRKCVEFKKYFSKMFPFNNNSGQ